MLKQLLVRSVVATSMVAGVVATAPATAGAAAPFPHITFREAAYSLPTLGQLPGKPDAYPVQTRSLTEPCLFDDAHLLRPLTVPLPKNVLQPTRTGATHGRSVYSRPLAWEVSTVAFPTPTAARAWLAKLATVQRSCPHTASLTYPWAPGERTLHSRQVSVSHVSAKGWTGYRGVVSLTHTKPALAQRQVWSVLVRGNALVFLSLTVDAKALSAKHEEQWRQKVQDRISAAMVRLSLPA